MTAGFGLTGSDRLTRTEKTMTMGCEAVPKGRVSPCPQVARWRRVIAVSLRAISALAFASAPLAAQSRAAVVTGRVGVATPSDNYQVNCGHSSLALGLDVRGDRALFPQLSLDHFTGTGGGDVACLAVDPALGRAVGGLRLDGASRVGVGVGARVHRGPVQLEGAVLGGAVAGRRGFAGEPASDLRRMMPHLGGQASLVLFRVLVISAATNWTRLTLDVIPTTGGTGRSRTAWEPMRSTQVGVRWGVGGGKRRTFGSDGGVCDCPS